MSLVVVERLLQITLVQQLTGGAGNTFEFSGTLELPTPFPTWELVLMRVMNNIAGTVVATSTGFTAGAKRSTRSRR